jgi:hypothetical protein
MNFLYELKPTFVKKQYQKNFYMKQNAALGHIYNFPVLSENILQITSMKHNV